MDISKLGNGTLPAVSRPDVSDIRPGVNSKTSDTNASKAVPFSDFLGDRLGSVSKGPASTGELRFSAHAKTRLESRGIDLSPDDLLRLQEAVQKAGEKGSRESLILSDKGAFIVSVKNNTVITAVDKASLKENVFTNIDSTIMI